MAQLPTPGAVLDFWIGPSADDHTALEARNKLWFMKSAETDAVLEDRFLPLLRALTKGLAEEWAVQGARQRLAAIIVLDQFSRNIFRNTAAAFAQDEIALRLTQEGLRRNGDLTLTEVERVFYYLPLEHSESLSDQNLSVEKFGQLVSESRSAFRPYCEKTLDYAVQHREVIQRFGRFPHRNAILGRSNTPEEEAYLAEPGAGF